MRKPFHHEAVSAARRPGRRSSVSLAAAILPLLLAIPGCDPTGPQYRAVIPAGYKESCVLILQTTRPADQGARFFIYRSVPGNIAEWIPLGPDRSGVAYGATIHGDELLVFHEKSVSAIGLSSEPPSWRSLKCPIEGILECGADIGDETWVFGKDTKSGRLAAARYRDGAFELYPLEGPEIPYDSFMLLASAGEGKIILAWRGVSKDGRVPDKPIEYCTFDGSEFSPVNVMKLSERGFIALWAEGGNIAGAVQETGPGYWGGAFLSLFRASPDGKVECHRAEGTGGRSFLFGFVGTGSAEVSGARYIFRADIQRVECWKVEGNQLVAVGELKGIPVHEHESWMLGMLAGIAVMLAIASAWGLSRRIRGTGGIFYGRVFGRIHERAIGYAIDTALMWGIGLATLWIFPSVGREQDWILPAQTDLGTSWFGIVMAYMTVFEWAAGATPGKWLMGMRVIGEDGMPPSLWQVIVRNAVGFYERNPLLAVLCAIPVMMFSGKVQRIGDMLGRTVVVTKEAAAMAALTGRLGGQNTSGRTGDSGREGDGDGRGVGDE